MQLARLWQPNCPGPRGYSTATLTEAQKVAKVPKAGKARRISGGTLDSSDVTAEPRIIAKSWSHQEALKLE